MPINFIIMKKTWIYAFALILAVLCGCDQKHSLKEEKTIEKRVAVKPGTVYESIACLSDTTFSYSLYLPGNYSENRRFPVLFFFDAHKRGSMPVFKYRELAEKYGFILAGSNNSVNGQTGPEMEKAIAMMINEVMERFHPDTARIYTGGFSGGARVAAYTALFMRSVAGVAGCAAGFPQITKKPHTGFIYMGFVGDEDFNYLEMKYLDRSLEGTPIKHLLVVYDGEHDWPPPEVMKNAFLFFSFDGMRRHLRPVDRRMVTEFTDSTAAYVSRAAGKRDCDAQSFGLKRAISFLSGLEDVRHYEEKLDKLMKTGFCRQQFERELKMEESEQQYQQLLSGAMGDPGPDSQLTREIDRIYKASMRKDDPSSVKMNRRLLNFLSLLSYMYAKNAFKQNDLNLAGAYLNIYEKVDADNPEVYYLKAVRLMRLDQPDAALEALKKAADYGFNELERIKKSRDFLPLHGDIRFQKVLNAVENNQELMYREK